MSDIKVAMVTGAAQGIGRGIALKLAADGFDIAVADMAFQEEKGRGVVAEIEALGRKAIFVSADVSKREEVAAAVDKAAAELGSFDVMVNNAGIVGQVAPIAEITEESMQKVFAVNVNSVLWGIQAAAAKFIELGKKGRIISAASIAAIKGFPILAPYTASKFAVRGITQVASQELAVHGITVNAYAPGIVGTSLWEDLDKKLAAITGKPVGQNLKENVDSISLGRIETPEDVAGVVSFFASPNAEYVTGQVLLVDGGMLYN
ncbi:meso-butanediol dehydrogenase/(S,S)-butanediol dehydrogenase/diacetyl reductase [Neomicrococcus aestuarii]|uniref:diacetyl reductase [(S)-acetoin forming] n=1 Tax=Neomicrococcus aestuarii TaxID=556325 RepID=A0A7W8WZ02_9MICC|nr:acetoin reductase [Neomicrococcus aestuarii]MBB5511747.1 meso-butanediol dehydrogenase/(S,S)-butanediol dehydrogenase/diacetyl reductase [Neomicrococcus aestuarii]